MNKLFFLIIFLFLFGCASNSFVNVAEVERAPLTKTTYQTTLNGELKQLSVYAHVENMNGKDVVVPNQYVDYNGQKFQITIYEEIEEFNGKNYVIPKEYKITGINEQGKIIVESPILFMGPSGAKYNVSFN